jgi:hypothetical protein
MHTEDVSETSGHTYDVCSTFRDNERVSYGFRIVNYFWVSSEWMWFFFGKLTAKLAAAADNESDHLMLKLIPARQISGQRVPTSPKVSYKRSHASAAV